MALSNAVQATTLEGFVPKVADTISSGYLLPMRLFANAKAWRGRHIIQPYQTTLPANVDSFKGLTSFTFADETLEVNGTFEHQDVYGTIALSGDDVDLNGATDAQVIDVMKLKFEQLQQSFGNEVATQLWADGTGNGGKDILGIVAAVSQAADVATYGGLARGTYSSLDAQQTASGGTISFDNMRTVLRNTTVGTNTPSLLVTTKTVFDLIESLILPTQNLTIQNTAPAMITQYGRRADMSMMQAGPAMMGLSGYKSIVWRGIPVAGDEKATTQTLYYLNEDTLQWYGLNSQTPERKNISITAPSTLSGTAMQTSQKMFGLSWKGWDVPIDQDGYVGVMLLKGTLVCSNPRYNGKLTGITTA